MKSSVLHFLGLSSLLVGLAACQPMNGNSLLTDQKNDPSSFALNKDPKSEELYLKSYAPTFQATGLSKLEVSGECYVSTYPSHNIIATRNGSQIGITDLYPGSAANSATCVNGKFNFAIDTNYLAGGSNTVRILIQARDASGNVVVNDAQGANNVTITK